MSRILLPGETLGLMGGGQLGRMFAQAAATMGYHVAVLEPGKSAPAAEVSLEAIVAPYDDEAALEKLARRVKAVTTEFENVPAPALQRLAELGVRTAPPASAVAVTQDRNREKTFVGDVAGVPVAPHAAVRNERDAETVSKDLLPGILKTARLGYDGKGQARVTTREEVLAAFRTFGGVDRTWSREEFSRMLAEALATAEAEYTQSDGYELMMQAQTDVIDSVRTDLSEANYLAGYDLAQQFTLGIEAANNANRERVQASYAALTPSNAGGGGNTVLGGGDASLESAADAFFWASGDASIYPHAGGLSYVPYNGYPARLHEGERVLTAEENRAFSSGTGGGVVITGNSFTVRQASDIEAIGEAIYQRILRASRLRA